MRMVMRGAVLIACLLGTTALSVSAAAQSASAPASPTLDDGFREPPMTARPLVWWHWMNGNITADGVRKDLEWMQRIGIGGVQAFDAALSTPQVVDKRLVYMTPEWKSVFAAAVDQASGYGFDFGIAASPGWSETGGPWVKPEDGQKKLVWTFLDVAGGRPIVGRLPSPPSTTGPYQTMPLEASGFASDSGKPTPSYYSDIAVLAYPTLPLASAIPTVSAAGTPIDGAKLWDGRAETAVDLPTKPGAPLVSYSYAVPQTVRSATFYLVGAGGGFMGATSEAWLQYRSGAGWTDIAAMPPTEVPTTISFAPVTAQEFRIEMRPRKGGSGFSLGGVPGVDMGGRGGLPSLAAGPAKTSLGEFVLSSEARVDRFEAKAAYQTEADYFALSNGVAETAGIDPGKVVDLTSRMRSDGTLDWTPPPGRWRILRIGASLTGVTNHPATAEATGLEVDKYDGPAVRRYFTTYLDMYRDVLGKERVGPKGLRTVVTDSIESGEANWTPRMIEQFRRLRGYDPTPYLPALTGEIVGSRSKSDAFLYDYRRTLIDLQASEHYGTIAQIGRESGLQIFGEAIEDRRPQLGDDIAMRSHADVPMAAMWTYPKGGRPNPTYLGDIRGAASVANIYGRKWVAAESLTSALSPYAFAPADLKTVIDLEFVNGVNRPVIHSSVHQPLDSKVPGLSLMIFGQNFHRHEAWAEMAKPWIDYIARSSFMLQQGRTVSDVAYFIGEEGPITQLWTDGKLADHPTANGYDFVNRDVLFDQLSVEDGAIVSKGGARYRLLYLGGESDRMTVPVLRKLAELVEAGAVVVGRAPQSTPSLSDDPAEFARLVARLWGGGPVGRGRVVGSKDLKAGLAAAGVMPDFSFSGGAGDSDIQFLHRRLPDGDVYFLSNRKDRSEAVTARFRITGKVPELWHAETGTSEAVSYRIEGGETVVPLSMEANDAVFVVFRKPASAVSATVAEPVLRETASLTGPWTVTFQEGRGAPANTILPALTPLEANADPRIKYFSGIATYRSNFRRPAGQKRGAPLLLDLGAVGDLAEVRVNGQVAGTVWHAPYRLDIGKLAKPGTNVIEVRVANLWVNRMIGDRQPGAEPITYTSGPGYRPDAPLRRSGLVGPVRFLQPVTK